MESINVSDFRRGIAKNLEKGKPILITSSDVPAAIVIPITGTEHERIRTGQRAQFNPTHTVNQILAQE